MDETTELKIRLYLSENKADYICAGCGSMERGLSGVNDLGIPYCSEQCRARGYNKSAMDRHKRMAGIR